MKWLVNKKEYPNIGDIRYVSKYAILPVYAYSSKNNLQYKIWLMPYTQKQKYAFTVGELIGGVAMPEYRWVEVQNIIH
jgi:hypothetical protein